MRDDPNCWHDYGGVKLMPMHFAGHALYVRLCRPGDAVDGIAHVRALDGIVLPDMAGDRSQWVEILAVGPNVGQRVSKTHAARYRKEWVDKYGVEGSRRSNVPRDIVGKLAYIAAKDDPRILKSPVGKDERFIEESLPALILDRQEMESAA